MFALIMFAALPAQLPEVGIHESRASDRYVSRSPCRDVRRVCGPEAPACCVPRYVQAPQVQPRRQAPPATCYEDDEQVIVIHRRGRDITVQVLRPRPDGRGAQSCYAPCR